MLISRVTGRNAGGKVFHVVVSTTRGSAPMPAPRFRHSPRPDNDVVDLLERVLASARGGYVRSVAIVAVNPIHQVETAAAGDLSEVRTSVLLGGLSRAANELMKHS